MSARKIFFDPLYVLVHYGVCVCVCGWFQLFCSCLRNERMFSLIAGLQGAVWISWNYSDSSAIIRKTASSCHPPRLEMLKVYSPWLTETQLKPYLEIQLSLLTFSTPVSIFLSPFSFPLDSNHLEISRCLVVFRAATKQPLPLSDNQLRIWMD